MLCVHYCLLCVCCVCRNLQQQQQPGEAHGQHQCVVAGKGGGAGTFHPTFDSNQVSNKNQRTDVTLAL